MKHVHLLAAAVLFGATASLPAAAQAAKPETLVRQAVSAMGGEAALRGLKSLTIKAEAKHWEPEQSDVVDGTPRLLGESVLTIAIDIEKATARTDHDHVMRYPFPGSEKYSDVVTPGFGAVIDDKGERPMSPTRLAFQLRELERGSPLLMLKALDAPRSLAALPDQKFAGQALPAIAFTDGATRFIILFDRKTHLPEVVRTLEDDDIHGDGNFDLILADWRPVGGVRIAHSLAYKMSGLDKLQLTYKDVAANAVAASAFAVADATRQAAKPPATGDVAWQAILVRINFGRFDDIAADKAAASGPGMSLVELAPNLLHAVGRSHNSLIVAMPSYLVVIDAPQSEAQSRWTIDAAKAKYPGKPIKYLVLTHHHMDHIAGARTYVAEGATVIAGSPDKAHLAKVFRASHRLHPDALQLHAKAATIIEVKDRFSLKEGAEELRLYRITNPHAQGMLIGYVVRENLVYVTDLYSPGRDKVKTPNSVAFYELLPKLGLEPARYAGGHGGNGTQAELAAIMAAQ
jgi:glyoxylase-like metal-dependent hydrolase (beta-lactamase superfamily II)